MAEIQSDDLLLLRAYGRRLGSSVYFVQGVHGGPIKIGFTDGPVSERVSTLQIGSPVELRLIGVAKDGTLGLERALHRRFASDRLHGEWFKPTADLLCLVAALTVGSGVLLPRTWPEWKIGQARVICEVATDWMRPVDIRKAVAATAGFDPSEVAGAIVNELHRRGYLERRVRKLTLGDTVVEYRALLRVNVRG